ncbi:MAG: sulfatase-like hydrolase/transferase [Petrimonas sp.]|jgi:arylsulfatase
MRNKNIFFCILSAGLSFSATDQKPNIIYIFIDDPGYADLGYYRQQKIETPNIDRLAENGMRFTQHYSGSHVSAPSRVNTLTGKYSSHAYIRRNDEMGNRVDVWNHAAMLAKQTIATSHTIRQRRRPDPRIELR